MLMRVRVCFRIFMLGCVHVRLFLCKYFCVIFACFFVCMHISCLDACIFVCFFVNISASFCVLVRVNLRPLLARVND